MKQGRLIAAVACVVALGAMVAHLLQPEPEWSEVSQGVFVVPIEGRPVKAQVVFPSTPSDGEAIHGLAHYLEHLVWANSVGASERTADRHSNAWASDDAVGYWLSGPPEDLPELLTTLRRVFDPLEVSAQFAEEEREIVLREYELRIAGDIVARAAEATDAYLYADTPFAPSVLGSPAQIEALTYDDASNLHRDTHVPEKARLVVSGDISGRAVRRALAKADWPTLFENAPTATEIVAAPASSMILRFPDQDAVPRLIWRRLAQLPEAIEYELLDAHTALLRDILDTNLPGGLAGPLRFDAPTARSFEVYVWPHDADTVEIWFEAAPDRGVTLADLQFAFEDVLASLADEGIPGSTFRRVEKRFEGFWPLWSDEADVAKWTAEHVTVRVASRRKPMTRPEVKSLSEQMQKRIIDRVFASLAGEGRTVVAYIGPMEGFE